MSGGVSQMQTADAEAAANITLSLQAEAAEVLFVNGQTTQATHLAVAELGSSLDRQPVLILRWGEIILQSEATYSTCLRVSDPTGVDIARVVATEALVKAVSSGSLSVERARTALRDIARRPPVSLQRFAPMAAAGAAALGVIFGAQDGLTLSLIAVLAGAGALLRRGVSHATTNPFAQPFLAALLAGLGAGFAVAMKLPVSGHLVAACPCMVLVPGPHFLNGAIDVARGRIPLGLTRIVFATLVAVAICCGLLLGLAAFVSGLPAAGPVTAVPLPLDVCAAGIAVAAYGSFFNMPWRMLPIPIAIGMLAHAARWALLYLGTSLPMSAFGACFLVGLITTPVARRFRLPFGASAFAAIVSLIPGVFMFQAASSALDMITGEAGVPLDAVEAFLRSTMTVVAVLLAMTAGLIVPKMAIDAIKAKYSHLGKLARLQPNRP